MTGKQNAPEIRFEGFTDPWEQRKLGEVAPLQRGFDLPVNQMMPGPYPVVMSNGIGGWHSKYMVKGPGVVTGRSGTIGSLHYIEQNFWPHNTSLWVTSFNGNEPRFIYWLYASIGVERFGSGSGVPTLNRNDVHDLRVGFPCDVAEQRRIGTFFSCLDGLITLHQRKYDKLCTVKKSMLDKMFPKPGETEPEIRFEGFTDPWEQRKLGDLYRSGDEKNERLEFNIDKTISVSTMTWNPGGNGAAAESLPLFKVLRYGDLAFEGNRTKGHPYGKLVVNDIGAGIMSSRFRTLAAKQTPCVSFWKYFLLNDATFRSIYINCTKRGTLMTELVVPELLQSSVLLPTEAEQSEIGTFFTQLDSLITLHQRKLELLRNIKKSLLDRMFV